MSGDRDPWDKSNLFFLVRQKRTFDDLRDNLIHVAALLMLIDQIWE